MGGGQHAGRAAVSSAATNDKTRSSQRESELAQLRQELKVLRQQLAETMQKIEKLEEED
jgi:hypothetical protein